MRVKSRRLNLARLYKSDNQYNYRHYKQQVNDAARLIAEKSDCPYGHKHHNEYIQDISH